MKKEILLVLIILIIGCSDPGTETIVPSKFLGVIQISSVDGGKNGTVFFSLDASGQASQSSQSKILMRSSQGLTTATGNLVIEGEEWGFKTDANGYYDSTTGEFTLTAYGSYEDSTVSVAFRGIADLNNSFTDSKISVIELNSDNSITLIEGYNALKPNNSNELNEKIINSQLPEIEKTEENILMSQAMGIWYGQIPSYFGAGDGKMRISVFGNFILFYVMDSDDQEHKLDVLWIGQESIDQDGNMNQHFAFFHADVNNFLSYRLKNKNNGRQLNMYMDENTVKVDPRLPDSTPFPQFTFETIDEAKLAIQNTRHPIRLTQNPEGTDFFY